MPRYQESAHRSRTKEKGEHLGTRISDEILEQALHEIVHRAGGMGRGGYTKVGDVAAVL